MVNVSDQNRNIAIKVMSDSYYKRKRMANGSKNYFNRFCQLLYYYMKFDVEKVEGKNSVTISAPRLAELNINTLNINKNQVSRKAGELLEKLDFSIFYISDDFYNEIYNYMIKRENNRGLYNNALMKYIQTFVGFYSNDPPTSYRNELINMLYEAYLDKNVERKLSCYDTIINIVY
jgi:hypothetical protein